MRPAILGRFLKRRHDPNRWRNTAAAVKGPIESTHLRCASSRVPQAIRPYAAMIACGGPLPNKRLKLSGDDRSKGSGVLCAGPHELSFNDTARGGLAARSLSAIR